MSRLGFACIGWFVAVSAWAAAPVRLTNDRLAFDLDPAKGIVVSGTDLTTNTRVYEQITGVYYIGRQTQPGPWGGYETRSVSESDDVLVPGSDSLKQINKTTTFTARYTNPGLADLVIEKTYALAPGATYAAKTLRVIPKRDLELGLEYGLDVTVTPAFRAGSYYHCPMGIHFGQVIPTWMKAEDVKQSLALAGRPETQVGAGGRGMQSFVVCTRPDLNRSAVTYRYRENGRFVRPPWMGYLGAGVYLNERGWKMGVFSDYLKPGSDLSGEVHLQIIPGDHVTAHRLWQQLPEWQQLIHDPSVQNDQSPQWLDRVKVMGMICEGVNGPLIIKQNYGDLVNEGPQMVMVSGPGVTVWSGDGAIGTVYFQDGGLYQKIDNHLIHDAQWFRDYIGGVRAATQPGAKMGLYHLSPEISLDISPRVKRYDANSWLSFFEGVKLPDDLQFIREQWGREMKAHGTEFIYMDGAAESGGQIDYERKLAFHQYDAMDIDRAVRQATRDSGADHVYWRNGEVNTYTDCGFAELSGVGDWNDMVKQTGWRNLADRIMKVKLYERPGKWVAPLYPGRANEYTNYVLALGFRPWGLFPSRLANAMYEVRDMRLMDADVKPCWWRDYGEIEAHALALGATRVLSAINHGGPPPGPLPAGEGGKDNGTTAVTADRKLLGLEDKPLFVWQCQPLPGIQQGGLNDHTVQAAWEGRWADGVAIARRLVRLDEEPAARVGATLELPFDHVRQLVMTHVPALIYAADGYRRNYPLTDFNDVSLRGGVDMAKKQLNVTANIAAGDAEVALVAPASWRFDKVLLAGKPVMFEVVPEDGATLAVVKLKTGKHVLQASCSTAPTAKLVVQVNGEQATMAHYVPGTTGQGLYLGDTSNLRFDDLGPWDLTRGSIELSFKPDFAATGDTSHIVATAAGEKFSFTIYKLIKHDGLCFNIHHFGTNQDYPLHAPAAKWQVGTWHKVRVAWDQTAGTEEMFFDGQSIMKRQHKLPDLTGWTGRISLRQNADGSWAGTEACDDLVITSGEQPVFKVDFEGNVRDQIGGREGTLSSTIARGSTLPLNLTLTADKPLPATARAFLQLRRDGVPIFTQPVAGKAEGSRISIPTTELRIPDQADECECELLAGVLGVNAAPTPVAALAIGPGPQTPPAEDPQVVTDRDVPGGGRIGHATTIAVYGKKDPTCTAVFDEKTNTFAMAVGTGLDQSSRCAGGALLQGVTRLGIEYTETSPVRQSRPALYMRPHRTGDTFTGVALDFPTRAGACRRVYVGIGAMTRRNSPFPAASWLKLPQDPSFTLADLTEGTKLGEPRRIAIDVAKLAPPDWDGRLGMWAVCQETLLGTALKVRLLSDAETAALPDAPVEPIVVNPTVKVPLVATAPTMDGKPDGVWQQAQPLKPFYDLGSISRAKQQSLARVVRDATNLYVLVECTDPQIRASYQGRDVAVWEQDDVEVFVQPDPAGPYYQLAVNAVGGTYDARGKDGSYNPAWEAKAFTTPTGWTAEMKIPLAAVERTDWSGQWRLGIGRLDRYDGGAELSSWPAYKVRDFHAPASWATLEF